MNEFCPAVKPSNIGRMAAIARVDGMGQVLRGNVLDLVADTDNPKRIRIQKGDSRLQGEVVNLLAGEYKFLWWADEEED